MRHLSTFGILLAATLLCGCSGTVSKITITPADVKEQSSSTVSVNAVTDSNGIINRLYKADLLKEHLKDADRITVKTCRDGDVYSVDEYREEGDWITEREYVRSYSGNPLYTTTRYKDNVSVEYYATLSSNEVIFRVYENGDGRVMTKDHPVIFTEPFYKTEDIAVTKAGNENDSYIYTVHNKAGSSDLYVNKLTDRVFRITDKFNTIYVDREKYPFERDPVKETDSGNDLRNILIHCNGEDYPLSIRKDIPFEIWCMEEDRVENEKHLFLDPGYTKPCSKAEREGDLELWVKY